MHRLLITVETRFGPELFVRALHAVIRLILSASPCMILVFDLFQNKLGIWLIDLISCISSLPEYSRPNPGIVDQGKHAGELSPYKSD